MILLGSPPPRKILSAGDAAKALASNKVKGGK